MKPGPTTMGKNTGSLGNSQSNGICEHLKDQNVPKEAQVKTDKDNNFQPFPDCQEPHTEGSVPKLKLMIFQVPTWEFGMFFLSLLFDYPDKLRLQASC